MQDSPAPEFGWSLKAKNGEVGGRVEPLKGGASLLDCVFDLWAFERTYGTHDDDFVGTRAGLESGDRAGWSKADDLEEYLPRVVR